MKDKLRGFVLQAIFIANLFLLFEANKLYSKQERECPYDSQQYCFSTFVIDTLTFKTILEVNLYVGFIFALSIFLTAVDFMPRKYLPFIVADLVGLLFIYHKDPTPFNLSYFYTWLVLYIIVVALIILTIYGAMVYTTIYYKNIYRKLKLHGTILSSFLVILSLYFLNAKLYSLPSGWNTGI